MTGPTNRLSVLRQRAELSQAALASICDVTEQTVSRWERGTTAIPDDTKRLLCDRFECSVEHLMGWDRIPATTGEAV